MKLNPPKEVYLEGWFEVDVDRNLTRDGMRKLSEKIKTQINYLI